VEITYHGANCIRIVRKKVSIVVDDNLSALGSKSSFKDPTIRLYSQKRFIQPGADGFIIDGPGEYEISGISIVGLAHRAHTDHEGEHGATIYRLSCANRRIGIVGHIDPQLSDEELERLGTIDILILPVGGGGYTTDAKDAAGLIRAIEPKIIIPTHYADPGLAYEVPQDPLKSFLQEIGLSAPEEDSLKITNTTLLPEQLAICHLKKQ